MLLRSKALTFLLLVCFSISLCAQLPKAKRFYLGASFMPIYVSQSFYQKLTFPIRAGIDVKFKITKRFMISSGLAFYNLSYENSYKSAVSTENFTSKTRILQMPLRLDVRFHRSKLVSTFVTAGAIADLYRQDLSAYTITNVSGTSVSNRNNKDFIFQPWLQFGLGMDITVSRLKLQVFPLLEAPYISHKVFFNSTQVGLAAAVLIRL